MSKKISILTPTYDRRKFLPIMIENIMSQTYPKHLLEWVICDSYSVEGVEAEPLFMNDKVLNEVRKQTGVEINYKYFHKRMTIGEKRNWMVKNAKYDILICMDSDDIYLPTYIQYSLDMLIKNKVGLCGSPQMLFIYPNHDYKTSFINCPAIRQIHEATMCFTRKHFRKMGGFSKIGNGEGSKMIDGCYEKDFYKTEVDKQMICICHKDNTCNKDKFMADRFLVDAKITGRQMEILQKLFSSASPE